MGKTALILIDIQNDYFGDKNGKFPLVGINEATLKAKTLLEAARKNNDIEIIHIQHVFDSDPAPFFGENTKGVEINSEVKPTNDELVIVKHSPNSFVGTKLEETLRSKNVTDLVIVGAMTHICIQGTTRSAAELGFKVIVPKDAVATRDLEFDGVIVNAAQVSASVFATLEFGYATVSSTEEVLKTF
ncbi:hypothetical protein BN7_6715 [Wickerhamomyces ciferrii]|uniref:Isochorismatase-like domain-containing protein n=1 Tax=Wickerhamomyces ciferrii (strain ATCC 14091 / BCRC 22168 / CBS 111 / JCM 3599 / NBRC 0793 / NRRL Y-1031 F-60-10) TaxID=1206466 RepID=K0L0K9_WICCF|nr:uncharacterized protein BN7_6715 [Wickerhamomyces ciferrii]CCH47104.1 hypothetical protein BN7_6715 [Wickerhamomyces ciferrii]